MNWTYFILVLRRARLTRLMGGGAARGERGKKGASERGEKRGRAADGGGGKKPARRRARREPHEADLYEAARRGDHRWMRDILALETAHVDEADSTGNTALGLAAWAASPRCVRALLRAGAQPRIANWTGSTPLLAAAARGCAASMEALLAAGATVGDVNSDGDTALAVALAAGRPEAAEVLLRAGADAGETDRTGRTLLQRECAAGRKGGVCLLLSHGAPAEGALGAAAACGHASVVEALLAAGAGDDRDETEVALVAAASMGHAECLGPLLRAHPRVPVDVHATLLGCAARRAAPGCVGALLEAALEAHGRSAVADLVNGVSGRPDAGDDRHAVTACMAHGGDEDRCLAVLDLLLEAGASPGLCGRAAELAMLRGFERCVFRIAQAGAPVPRVLSWAAEQCRPALVDDLLRVARNLDRGVLNCAMLAATRSTGPRDELERCVLLLVGAAGTVHASDPVIVSCVCRAAALGSVTSVRALIAAGADPSDRTARHRAVLGDHAECVEALCDAAGVSPASLLETAVRAGARRCVAVALRHDTSARTARRALRLAVRAKKPEVLSVALRTATCDEGLLTRLVLACAAAADHRSLRVLLDAGAKPGPVAGKSPPCPLLAAACKGSWRCVKLLVRAGVKVPLDTVELAAASCVARGRTLDKRTAKILLALGARAPPAQSGVLGRWHAGGFGVQRTRRAVAAAVDPHLDRDTAGLCAQYVHLVPGERRVCSKK